ncbi:hypothetical protein [Dysgonomonas sp. HGC4]|uniref:hypothetical protein n=1 Tax=Dysgonomonas sp. HGC4 TaxID=1658009 RepID=UPI000682CC74|nr:hypothetical protein [Dysgonomonas sp. HGC4]MBD8349342.1 hypothetical protein [Dysgonomonas sp. HGC4]
MRNVELLDEVSAVLNLGDSVAFVNTIDISEIDSIIGDDISPTPVKVDENYRGYVSWGDDNQRPYKIVKAVEDDEVLSQNNHFNALTCYASGLRYRRDNDEKVRNEDIIKFFKYNNPVKYLLDQVADMKYFLFTVSLVIVNKEGSKITKLRHKEAIHCRFESCNPRTGQIEHLFYGDFEDKTPTVDELEVIPVLDYYDPIGDLEVRFGRIPNENGEIQEMTTARKFAIVNLFPTVGKKYYPFAPWYSVFNSGWYKYKRIIPKRKFDIIKSAKVKYKVEINSRYWEEIFKTEVITDKEEQKKRRIKELENIRDFLGGIDNANKVLVTGCYVDPDGNTHSMVTISLVDTKKEGGDLIEDSAEASNMLCYAMGVHPGMIGAYPGKGQGSYSGSVQRELFTIKQSLEKPYHDILLTPYHVIKEFNKYDDLKFDIPVITLTVLSTGGDAEEKTLREPDNNQ